MTFLLVPREVGPATASVWVGAIDESPGPANLVLSWGAGQRALEATWQAWPPGSESPRLWYQTVLIEGLESRQTYPLDLRADGASRAQGSVATLPQRLPPRNEKPFTVFLGSCFFWQEDAEGRLGNLYFRLPAGGRPDLKLLCGDQVYLDAPWLHFLLQTHNRPELEAHFFDTYKQTWTQSGTASGFRRVLADGGNYFTADDHEFWNNAPNRATVVRDTWTQQGRHDWFAVARDLYRAFQTEVTVTTMVVPPLSLLMADTRVDRRADESDFMKAEDLQRIARWVDGLAGPGALVLGQPVFDEPAGLAGHLADWGLPDYPQYRELVRILVRARHSLVILTGDVHFGRIARCQLWSGAELIEVISSPMALVDERARGSWKRAPAQFPPFEIPDVVPSPVHTEDVASSDNHFLTLEFSDAGGPIDMVVKYWPIRGPDGPASPREWYRARLR